MKAPIPHLAKTRACAIRLESQKHRFQGQIPQLQGASRLQEGAHRRRRAAANRLPHAQGGTLCQDLAPDDRKGKTRRKRMPGIFLTAFAPGVMLVVDPTKRPLS